MKNTMVNVKRTLNLLGLQLKKHTPEIMVVAGCAGAVTASVMACKATLRLNEALDECKARKDDFAEVAAEMKAECRNDEDNAAVDKVCRKENFKIAVKNTCEIGKLYAPAVAVGTASIGLIFGANSIQRRRNASLAAAYATLNSMYKKYRKNVIETFGEDTDRDMRFGVKHEKVEETEVDENGKSKKVKKVVDVVDDDAMNWYSDYARWYDSSVPGYDKDPELNRLTLMSYQNYANNLLIARGYLFLNEVYKIIGIKGTMAGQSVGWIYDPENNDVGDNYIDFGITKGDAVKQNYRNSFNDECFLLDFNVDGDLLNNPKLNELLFSKMGTK